MSYYSLNRDVLSCGSSRWPSPGRCSPGLDCQGSVTAPSSGERRQAKGGVLGASAPDREEARHTPPALRQLKPSLVTTRELL